MIEHFVFLFSEHKMVHFYWVVLSLVFYSLVGVIDASAGNVDPIYRDCMSECERTGCVGERCFPVCYFYSDVSGHWYTQLHFYVQWKERECQDDCNYYCMLETEKGRAELGLGIAKYHGKWPFKRVYGMQEVASVAFSVLNLTVHLRGWHSFFFLLYYKLPLKADKKPYYDYAGLWHGYGLLSLNSWFWSAIFHTRDVDLTEKLDYSSAVAVIGYSLIVAIIRSFSVRNEATRVMVAAPLFAFVTTHILYLNNYKMDYGWNIKVCVLMGVAQLLIWAIWAGGSNHPSCWKVWFVVVGTFLAMLLEVYDFPPYEGYVDAHALWHAATVPLTYVWWSYIKDDAKYQTSKQMKKLK